MLTSDYLQPRPRLSSACTLGIYLVQILYFVHISWMLMKHNFWISLKTLIKFESAQPFFLPGSAGNNSPIYLILFKMVSALCAVGKFFNMLFLQYNMVIPQFFFHFFIWLYIKEATVLKKMTFAKSLYGQCLLWI